MFPFRKSNKGSSSKPSSSSSSSSAPINAAPGPLRLSSVSFSTKDCTRATYDRFIRDIKNIVVDPNPNTRHLDVPALRSQTGDLEKDLFKIHLTDHKGNRVSIVGRTHNLYLIAYETKNDVFWFNDTSAKEMDRVFPDKQYKLSPIGIKASYTKLDGYSKPRIGMSLGVDRMAEAITKLSDPRNGVKKPTVSSAFIVLLQMIAESVRLRKLNRKIRDCFEPDVNKMYPTIEISEYDAVCQNTWGTLSDIFRLHDNMRADLSSAKIKIKGGEKITEDDVRVAVQSGVDRDSLDWYYVTNMRQVRHIVDVLNCK